MKTLHQTNCEIFDIVKDKELILYSELPKMIGVDQDLVLQSIGKLTKDHDLISVKNQKLSLSEKGLLHESFELYLESLNKKPLEWYKIIPIILTVIFGSLSVYFLKANYDLKVNESNLIKKNDSLINSNDFLKYEFEIYKDSLAEIKGQLESLKLKPSKNTVIAKKKNDSVTE